MMIEEWQNLAVLIQLYKIIGRCKTVVLHKVICSSCIKSTNWRSLEVNIFGCNEQPANCFGIFNVAFDDFLNGFL